MKSRVVIDLQIFNSILRELKGIRKELKVLKGKAERKPVAKHQLNDAIGTAEAMRILKVSPMTLMNYEKEGLIKFHKEGRVKIYSETEVRAFKKNRGRRKRLTKGLLEKFN